MTFDEKVRMAANEITAILNKYNLVLVEKVQTNEGKNSINVLQTTIIEAATKLVPEPEVVMLTTRGKNNIAIVIQSNQRKIKFIKQS